MHHPAPASLAEARHHLGALFTDSWLCRDAGMYFTCADADTIAAWLRITSGETAANRQLNGHARADTSARARHRDRNTTHWQG